MIEIALFEPEIPPNTGNIIRLTVCSGTGLHIVGQPSFSLEDSMLRRAGLDYYALSRLTSHNDFDSFVEFLSQRDGQSRHEILARICLFTRFATNSYAEHRFRYDQIILFGKETTGLPPGILDRFAHRKEQLLRIPVHQNCRSLNLANSVSIVLYEGLRQLGFPGLDRSYVADTDTDVP
ncbi:MAG: tRNA (cytidine(34)-2'-O)-methyltransferase [Leptospiraceae bacterium]|nr:tRNA (cytidine(34)-2'-O)-methyltransferase [Leptospiraceae bacterium]